MILWPSAGCHTTDFVCVAAMSYVRVPSPSQMTVYALKLLHTSSSYGSAASEDLLSLERALCRCSFPSGRRLEPTGGGRVR